MFITDEDYKVVIGDQALKVVSQVSQENRANAETEAVEEISGYLRPKYDTSAIFSAAGTERNKLIVMYTCDIALYHMAASAPQKMGMEIRKERYERAIIPDLPLSTDEQGHPDGLPVIYGSQKQLHHNW